MKKNGKIFVLSAPSGAGKSTVAELLLKNSAVKKSISYTTREPRECEKNKRDYFFITRKKFLEKVKNKFFAEWAKVHGNYYGTALSFIDKHLKKGLDLLLVIDTAGALKIKRKYKKAAILIFLLPPSILELKRRLKKRGTEKQIDLKTRLENAKKELRQIKYYDHVVMNRKIDDAVKEIKKIIINKGD